MSSDGPRNFDSDQAYDALGILLQELVSKIRTAFTYDSVNSLYDDLGEGRIMANIDIILTLCTHYGAYPSGINKLEEISRWKNDYLSAFDRTIHLYSPSPGYAEKRREIIVETFDKLYNFFKEMLEDV